MSQSGATGTANEQTADAFLKTILRSGLFNREQLQNALRGTTKEQREDPNELANFLVKQGKLSRFQAEKLLQGASLGLTLGPYQILTPIGRGGMGSVYLAVDTRNQQHLAIKVLPPKRAREQQRYLARFQREMEISQRVIHPHIALTFEAGVSQGVNYIAMEFIPGMSLYRLVNRYGVLEVPRAARLFAELASALSYAHSQGLVHRDLKPSNILITPNDHAKLLDLGLALDEADDQAEKEVTGGQKYIVGSMDYIAPEQTEDATKVDARADIYSLGCSLYFALTGRPPFPGGTTKEKIRGHRYDEPPSVRDLNSRIPEDFAHIVKRMMAKLPQDRFTSADQLRDRLLPWAAGEEVLPLDKPSDPSFIESVKTLETGEISSELMGDVIARRSGEGSELDAVSLADPPAFQDKTAETKSYFWVFSALAGFWILVLAVLSLLVILRN